LRSNKGKEASQFGVEAVTYVTQELSSNNLESVDETRIGFDVHLVLFYRWMLEQVAASRGDEGRGRW